MELWGLELVFRGHKLSVVELENVSASSKPLQPQPVQLTLWDSIKFLSNEALTVKVEKKSPHSITLQVQIGFRAG